MKITKSDDVLFLQGYMQKSGRNFFVATVGYVLEMDGTLVPESEAWAWLLKYFPDEPFDAGLKKTRGTFAVAGNAYAPHGTPVRQMAVRASVGALQKTVHVHGDRQWHQGVLGWRASDPAPFTEMPIDLAHAFGGAQHPENPFGRGWWANADDAEGQPLPNLELPNRPVTRPDDDAPVATLGNLYVGAASRARMLGTFDTQWQATRFPGLPDDHDPRWFDAVPQDQCIPEYWRGDESWSVSGMHAQRETVQGTLPGLRPQMVFQRSAASPWTEDTPASGPEQAHFELDTVWLFPNDERVMLLYRTSIAVQREDAADIAAAGIFTAGADELPKDVPQLTEKWLESDFSVLDYLPEALGVIGALAGAAALAAKVKDYYDKEKKKKEEKQRKKEAQQPAPVTPATSTPSPAQPLAAPAPVTTAPTPPATTTPAPASANAPASLASATDGSPPPAETAGQPANTASAAAEAAQASPTGDAWADEVWQDMTRRYNESWEEGRQLLRVLEEDNEGHLPFSLSDPGPFAAPPAPELDASPPGAPPDDLATVIDARIEAALEEGRQLFEQAIQDAVSEHPELMEQLLAHVRSPAPGTLPTLDQMEQILLDMPQDVRERAESELLELEARFNALRQEIDATFHEGGSGDSSDGPGSTPPTVSRPAMAENAGVDPVPSSSTVPGTGTGDGDGDAPHETRPEKTPGGFVSAGPGRRAASDSEPENATPTLPPPPLPLPEPILLVDQNLRAADLRGADYRGAVLQNCDFSGADLSGANLSGAALQGCILNGANLDGADLERADVRDVDMRRASLSSARADHATFTDTDLSGANLADARLSRASFEDCRLDGARLDRATLENATMSGVQGDKVSFTGIQAQGLRLDSGTHLSEADFSNARLENASIQDSFLTNADLSNADMTASFFRASDLSGSTAQAAQAADATFKDVRLTDASWSQANLMHASFDNTLIHNVDLSGSNLYAAQTRIADVRGIRVQNSLLDSSQLLKEAHGA